MIEIIWKDTLLSDLNIMMYATNLIAWLTSLIAHKDEYRDVDLNGYMVVKEQTPGCSILVICNDIQSQKKVLDILQQPPEEFRDKYIARVPTNEPDPVKEQKKSENDDDDDDDEIEINLDTDSDSENR